MTQNYYIQNLFKTLQYLDEASNWLRRSYGICQEIGLKDDYSPDEFDKFETLTSRFARVSDIIIQKVFRSIDAVEFEEKGTLIDVVNRAHKRNLINSIDEIREIKDLRNEIAHEYIKELLIDVFQDSLKFTPKLFEIINKIKRYCERYNDFGENL